MKRFFVGVAITFFTASGSLASDWKAVSISRDDAIYYIDKETIRTTSSGYPKTDIKVAWFKIDHSRDKTVTYRESKMLYHFRCDTDEMKLVQWTDYKPDGSIDNSGSSAYSSFKVAVPDTVGSSMLKAACLERFLEE